MRTQVTKGVASVLLVIFFKQKTAYEMRISDWSSDVCSSDLHDQADVSGGSQARDPVCGMSVDPAKTPHHADHAGMTYHFCSAGCRTKFVSDPERYLGPPAPQADVPPGTIWT